MLDSIIKKSLKYGHASSRDARFLCGRYNKAAGEVRINNLYFKDLMATIHIQEGAGFIEENGRQVCFRAGDLIQRRPGHRIRVIYDTATEMSQFSMHFPGAAWKSLVEEGNPTFISPVLQVGTSSSWVSRYEKIIHSIKKNSLGQLYRVQVMMLQLLADLYQSSEKLPDDGLWRSARERLERDLELPLTMGEVAEFLGMSESHFYRSFKERVGISPMRYRIEQRIERAQQELAHSELSVQELSRSLGYPDPFTFSRQFKLVTGCSPRIYRKKNRC